MFWAPVQSFDLVADVFYPMTGIVLGRRTRSEKFMDVLDRFAVLLNISLFIMGLYLLFFTRATAHQIIGNHAENIWGFGQILPLLLLLLPLLQGLEIFYGIHRNF